jgi:hypothetical protein
MSQTCEGSPRGGGCADGPEVVCLSANASDIAKNPVQAQAKKRGGRAPKAKGSRFERAVVRLLQDHGLGAERVPLSYAAGGSYLGDLTVPILGHDLVVEAKARGNGFARLYSWLEGRDVLVIRADRCDAIVVLRLGLAAEIARVAEGRKP